MSLPEIFTFIKANSLSAAILSLLVYIILRAEITFRYPARTKPKR